MNVLIHKFNWIPVNLCHRIQAQRSRKKDVRALLVMLRARLHRSMNVNIQTTRTKRLLEKLPLEHGDKWYFLLANVKTVKPRPFKGWTENSVSVGTLSLKINMHLIIILSGIRPCGQLRFPCNLFSGLLKLLFPLGFYFVICFCFHYFSLFYTLFPLGQEFLQIYNGCIFNFSKVS